MAALKVKGTSDTVDRVMKAIRRTQPTTDAQGTFDLARSREASPSYTRYVVTTGIRPFDDRVGGMPVGKTIELIGRPGCGKTNMAVRTAVRAQQGWIYRRVATGADTYKMEKLAPGTFDVTILYFDNEGSLSDPFMLVADGTRMDGIIEQCDTVDVLWKHIEIAINALNEVEAETSRLQFLIVVVDTVAAMTSRDEIKKEWGTQDFPRKPAQLNEGFRVMLRRLNRDNVLLLGTNHVNKIMDGRGSRVAFKAWEYAAPGGSAFKYYAHHRIFFEPIQTKYRLIPSGGADGILVYFFTEKNRIMRPLVEGRLAFLYGERDSSTGAILVEGGFNTLYSTLETLIYAKAAEVNKESGAITFKFRSWGVKLATFDSKATAASLEDDGAPPVAVANTDSVRKREPRIGCRAEWPSFYTAHKTDLDNLYEAVHTACLHKPIDASVLQGIGDDLDVDDDNDNED